MKCILICLLISWFSGFGSEILALRCASPDGLSVEDVRKVVQKCMRKSLHPDSGNKNYDEYENFESGSEISLNNERNSRRNNNNNDRLNTYGNNFNSRVNLQYDPKTGGNYNEQRSNDRPDASSYQSSSTYNDNNNSNNRNLHNNRNYSDDHRRNDSGSDAGFKNERERACILQCFFQEFKMTNSEGFPDKHKAIHVLTKELRDRELKDFYTDSLQDCFHMMDIDSKVHRDSCLYSKNLMMCLAEHARMNCADWDGETVIF